MKTKRSVTINLTTHKARALTWLDFYLKDHHFLRIWWWNIAEIAPGVSRSNQPSPQRLRQYKAMGIKTVVSLRGASSSKSFNRLEKQACAHLGLNLHHVGGVSARDLKSREIVLRALDALATIPRPFVMHCKSGADRTGFLSALYLICVEGVPVTQATQQLARKYIHFPRSGSGVLDHVFRVYLRDAEPLGQGFRQWLETGYDPTKITLDFKEWRAGVGRWAK
jgi:protein tyrosine/serine phosphatase